MSLRAMNVTGQDHHDEELRACGLEPPSPEEELVREWEVRDALESCAVELGLTGRMTAFAPHECVVIARGLGALLDMEEMLGGVLAAEVRELTERVSEKATVGAQR